MYKNRMPLEVRLRFSVIVCPYCLQFGQVIVKRLLWGLPAWVGV
jgi:hypothetical protein